jgi:molybdopterin-containing oxidoreductase family iron-sulfur binding subunit
MTRYAMAIDLDRCTGCEACVAACRVENNVPFPDPEEPTGGRSMAWMEMLRTVEGEFPRASARFLPLPCMHCEDAPCVKVCPVGATYQSEDGIVGQVYARCIGCRYCTTACPYTRRFFNWRAPKWREPLEQMLNPDVSVRPKGVVEKCTFCVQRIRKVKESARRDKRHVRDDELRRLPACAATCPTDAITFGDLDDPDSEVAVLSRSPRSTRLFEDLGTRPKVFYLSEIRSDESGR